MMTIAVIAGCIYGVARAVTSAQVRHERNVLRRDAYERMLRRHSDQSR